MSIGEDADVKAVDTRSDQRLHLLKHLVDQSERRETQSLYHTSVVSGVSQVSLGVTNLLLCCLWSEDFVQFKGHDLSLVGEVEDGVVIRVEAQHGFGIGGGVLLLLTDGPDAAENTDVTWETESRDTGDLAQNTTSLNFAS